MRFLYEVKRMTSPEDFKANEDLVNGIESHNQSFFIKLRSMGWNIEDSLKLTNHLIKVSCEAVVIPEEAYVCLVNSMFTNKITLDFIDDNYIDDLIKKINQ